MGLEDYRRDMEMCSRCSLCKFIPMERVTDAAHAYGCPSIARYNFHAYSGGGRLTVGLATLDGRVEHSSKTAEIAYNCLMCGSCDVACKYAMDMEVLEPLAEIRASCVDSGHSLPVFEGLIQRLREESVSLARPVSQSRLGPADLGVKDSARESAHVVYHLGCQVAHDGSLQAIAQKTVDLLQRAGVDVGVLGEEEVCCGGRALELGYKRDFLVQADRCLAALQRTGAKILVTNCAHCYQAFKVQYPRAGRELPLKVIHAAELLFELAQDDRVALGEVPQMKVTYQDPCHLGRLGEPFTPWQGTPLDGHRRMFDPPKPWRRGTLGVYGPPRDLVSAIPGVELVEMSRTKEYAWCCGGGGGVPESNPEFGAWTAAQRVAEAEATGAQAIVTACPGCRRMLSQAADQAGSALRVLDIVELLAPAGQEGSQP